jgi:hypothetical protein
MSYERVALWLEALRRHEEYGDDYALSTRGIQAAMSASLSACDAEALAHVQSLGGTAYPRVTLALASTVATAAIEWCAVLLARGSALTLKVSTSDHGVCPLLVHYAQEHGLPLSMTTDRAALEDTDLVIAMGSDETIETIRDRLHAQTAFLGFGHRFSIAWVPREVATDPTTWMQIAIDLALHDSRGCMSPLAIFTDAEQQQVMPFAQHAMREAETAIPRGKIAPIEGAQIRGRGSLAQVTGLLASGENWSVHILPIGYFDPQVLPRSMGIYTCAHRGEVLEALRPYADALSIVSIPDEEPTESWLELGAERTCAFGEMQSPPLVRLHNGIDWLQATMKRS